MIMLELAVKSNKDLAALMTVERLEKAKGRAPMTFPQYILILKSHAHELDAEDGNSSRGGCSRYQSIHQSEQGGGREGRGAREAAAVAMAVEEDAVVETMVKAMGRKMMT